MDWKYLGWAKEVVVLLAPKGEGDPNGDGVAVAPKVSVVVVVGCDWGNNGEAVGAEKGDVVKEEAVVVAKGVVAAKGEGVAANGEGVALSWGANGEAVAPKGVVVVVMKGEAFTVVEVGEKVANPKLLLGLAVTVGVKPIDPPDKRDSNIALLLPRLLFTFGWVPGWDLILEAFSLKKLVEN